METKEEFAFIRKLKDILVSIGVGSLVIAIFAGIIFNAFYPKTEECQATAGIIGGIWLIIMIITIGILEIYKNKKMK